MTIAYIDIYMSVNVCEKGRSLISHVKASAKHCPPLCIVNV